MVDEYKEIAKKIQKKKYILLFAIYKMDEVTDRWSLLFGFDVHSTVEQKRELSEYVHHVIQESLSLEELQNVARIGIFDSTYHLISESLKFKKDTHVTDKKVNGSFVTDGYILVSKSK